MTSVTRAADDHLCAGFFLSEQLCSCPSGDAALFLQGQAVPSKSFSVSGFGLSLGTEHFMFPSSGLMERMIRDNIAETLLTRG